MIRKKFDVHCHVTMDHRYPTMSNGTVYHLTCDELRAMYDKIGVEKGNALPEISPEFSDDVGGNRDTWECYQNFPDTIGWWFCNIDPRWLTNSPEADLSVPIQYYKSLGAKGIGELTANLPINDPRMQNLFFHAQKNNMPIIFHMGRPPMGDYGIIDEVGIPQLEETLKKFPNLRLLGHSQKWWAEISGDCTEEIRSGYPEGPVKEGGRVVELMRKYPNMCGDLSANSGGNAIMRDPEFGYRFLEEFQDQLYYGIDYCQVTDYMPLSLYLDDAVESGHISQKAYDKICVENLLKLMEG